MDFFPPLPAPSYFLLLQTSPLIFPRIKNPFWIIHSVLNLAGTCIHNKLNLPRRFWDLSWMCQWQTTKIPSFIFNGNRSSDIYCLSKALRGTDKAFFLRHSFWTFSLIAMQIFYEYWNCCSCHIMYEMGTFSHILPKDTLIPKQRPLHWSSNQNRERSASHFLMVTQAMRPGNWTVGGILSVHHMTCLKSL